MRMELVIRFDYGSVVPWVQAMPGGSRVAVAGPDAISLRTPVEVRGENLRTVADFAVSAGERQPFVLTWYPSHHDEPAAIDPEQSLEDTCGFWRDWISHCTSEGRWREAVQRARGWARPTSISNRSRTA